MEAQERGLFEKWQLLKMFVTAKFEFHEKENTQQCKLLLLNNLKSVCIETGN